VVSPDTVVRWHRASFGRYWRLISRRRKSVGRRPVTKQIRQLIFKIMAENPTWRAPRIHGELLMLGFDISERSVSRWMRRASTPAVRPSGGSLFFAITAKPSPPSISSQYRPSLLTCYTSSSSLAMIDGAFFTLTLHLIQRASGSCSR